MPQSTGELGSLLSRINVQAIFVSGEEDPLVNESTSKAYDHYFRGRYIYNNEGLPLEFQWHDSHGIPYLMLIDDDQRGGLPPWSPKKGPDINYVFRLQENEVDAARAVHNRRALTASARPEDQPFLEEGQLISSKASKFHDLNETVPKLTLPGHAPIPNWQALLNEEKLAKKRREETHSLTLYQHHRAQSIQAPSKIPSLAPKPVYAIPDERLATSPGPVAMYYEKVTIAYPRNNQNPVLEAVLRLRSADGKILGYKPLPENENTSFMRTNAQPNPASRPAKLPEPIARPTSTMAPIGTPPFRYGAPPARSPSPLPVSINPPQEIAPEILEWLAGAPFNHPAPEEPMFPAGLAYWISNGPDGNSYMIPLGMRDQWQCAMPNDAFTTLPLPMEVPVHKPIPFERRKFSTTQSEIEVRPVVLGDEVDTEEEQNERLLGREREKKDVNAAWERGRKRGHIRGQSRSDMDLREIYAKKN